jgi:hypothetical protein
VIFINPAMKLTSIQSASERYVEERSKGSNNSSLQPLNIVIVFDCPEHLTKARDVFEKLLGKAGAHFLVHSDEWRVADLENNRFREEALELARHCDIFAIATGTLPARLIEFTSEWLTSPTQESAALVLIAFGTQCAGDFEFLGLRQLAHRNHVEYFSTILEREHKSERGFAGFMAMESSALNE